MIVNWLDIILIIVLLTTLVLGLIKGLIRQVIGIVAAVAGLILAALFYQDAAGLLKKLIRNERWADCLGFLLIFFGCLLVGWLIGWLLSKLMKGPFKFINHLLGGVLGLLKGVLICGVIVFALLVFPIFQSALERSTLSPYCLAITKAMVQVVPAELKDKFRVAYQDIIGRIGSHGKKI
jgi:membrane protein required for colicin V production